MNEALAAPKPESAAGSSTGQLNGPGRFRAAWAAGSRVVAAGMLDLLFPPTCACCLSDMAGGEAAPGLCGRCADRLFPRFDAACPRCGYPFPPGGRATREEGCTHCMARRFRFDRAIAIGVYQDTLQLALLRMKQFRGQRLALAVGRTMAARLSDQLADLHCDLIVPVPSPWRRRLARGTNSPGILARQLGRALSLPVFPDLLRWRRKVKRQHTLLPAERFQNVHRALGMSRGYTIGGARVLVVDDILTTGATANEAPRVLRKAGASQVCVAVVARVADR